MRYEDISGLRKYYQNIANEAVKEAAQLRKEVSESEAQIRLLDVEAREAAKRADDEAYKAARLSANMHEERIEMNQVRIVDLEYKHLVSDEEFQKVDHELKMLQHEITNEHAAKFMEAIEVMRNIAAEYEDMMAVCNAFGAFIQGRIYRKLSPIDGSPSYRPDYKLPGISRIVRLIQETNKDWSIDMMQVRQAAGHYVKAEALKKSAGKNEKLIQKAEREAQAGELPEIAADVSKTTGGNVAGNTAGKTTGE